MKWLLVLLLAAWASTPALAQHQGHTMPMPSARPAPRAAPPARPAARPPTRAARPAAGRRAAPARPRQPARASPAPATRRAAPQAVTPVDPHAGHVMPTSPTAPAATPAGPHAGHDMGTAQTGGAMQGHDMNAMPQSQGAGATAGHDMNAMAETADPPAAPPPPAALTGPAHAADTAFPVERMNEARALFQEEHGAIRSYRVFFDQLEARIQNGRDGYAWDAEAWYGGAINRLWLKSEGEGEFGRSPEQAEVQALWSHALDPWFNLQAGVRYDFRPNPQRAYLVLGIEGLAPYWFEVDGAVFLSDRGDLSARFEGEYDLRVTQRLILQPRVEMDFALQDAPEIGVGSGLSSTEAGLRLRYEIVPEFAPYVGVHYGRAFGDTARFRRAAGEDVGGWSFLIGVRTWF